MAHNEDIKSIKNASELTLVLELAQKVIKIGIINKYIPQF